MMSMSESEGGK